MTETDRRAHNAAKQRELHAWLRPKVAVILADLEGHGWRPRIQQAWRSMEAQAEAYRLGHSKVRWGFHNAEDEQGMPEALAADIVDDNRPYNETRPFLMQLAASASAHGLETGIRFGLSRERRRRLAEALTRKEWHYSGPIGWDPWHVQPTPATLTVAQARAGDRP